MYASHRCTVQMCESVMTLHIRSSKKVYVLVVLFVILLHKLMDANLVQACVQHIKKIVQQFLDTKITKTLTTVLF